MRVLQMKMTNSSQWTKKCHWTLMLLQSSWWKCPSLSVHRVKRTGVPRKRMIFSLTMFYAMDPLLQYSTTLLSPWRNSFGSMCICIRQTPLIKLNICLELEIHYLCFHLQCSAMHVCEDTTHALYCIALQTQAHYNVFAFACAVMYRWYICSNHQDHKKKK